jgi:hypothetical protein
MIALTASRSLIRGIRQWMKLQALMLRRKRFPQPGYSILMCCYHKTGTVWFNSILSRISVHFGWEYALSHGPASLPLNGVISLHSNSNVELQALEHQYVGCHVIRDPRDMIVSAYYYHRWCHEEWCTTKSDDGLSWQDRLLTASESEGMTMEIRRASYLIEAMLRWDYTNPNFLEVRFEDLITDPSGQFQNIFQRFGFSDEQVEVGLKVVKECSFEKMTKRQRGQEAPTHHFRKGVAGDWKQHFKEEHILLFKELYPGALTALGYEPDDSW